jgi:hypothetical protein
VTRVSEHVHRSDWRREHGATQRMERVHAALKLQMVAGGGGGAHNQNTLKLSVN